MKRKTDYAATQRFLSCLTYLCQEAKNRKQAVIYESILQAINSIKKQNHETKSICKNKKFCVPPNIRKINDLESP